MNRRTILSLATLLMIFVVNNASGWSEKTDASPETLEELKAAIELKRQEHHVPAVGIAMVDEDGPVWVGSLGLANLEHTIPADEQTMYRIGSVSKMFVSLAVLKLVEEGRLSLDDRLVDLAPEIAYENPWEDTDPIRIVHLLEHTTGWDDSHLVQFAHNDPTPATLKQGLDFHPHSRKSRWKPGTRMAYCNAGPPVAAYVVQKITGQDFEDYVAENFFRPMGMESISYQFNDDVERYGATLYSNNKPHDYRHISMRPSGAINVSPSDMSHLLNFYVNRGSVNGESLVSAESLARMERSTSTNGARAGLQLGYGLSNYTSPFKNWVYREHRGGFEGAMASLAYLPEAKTGHAIMINTINATALKEISALVRAYETRNLEPPPLHYEPEAAKIPAEIEGLYMPIDPRNQTGYFIQRILGVEFVWLEEQRIARKPLLGGIPEYYYPVGENLFRPENINDAGLTITSDPLAGEVMQVGSRTYQPVSSMLVYSQLGAGALWGMFIASSFIFFPVWSFRRLRRKIPAGLPTQVRVWPLLGSLCIVAVVVLVAVALRSNPFELLGNPSPISLTIMIATIFFAVFSMAGVYTSYRARNIAMNRVAYWHSTLGVMLHGTVMLYLLYYGVIGLRTWA